jgi:putative heme-binding domain-containing protein
MRRYAAEASRPGYLACARLLDAAAAKPVDSHRLLAALDAGLKDRAQHEGGSAGTLFANLAVIRENAGNAAADSGAQLPPELIAHVDRAWQHDEPDLAAIGLAARIGRTGAINRAIQLAGNGNLPIVKRIEAVGILADVADPSSTDTLLALAATGEPQPLALAAIEGLGRSKSDKIAAALLAAYPKLDAKLRAKTCDLLLGRKEWAARLLTAVDAGKIPTKEISVDQLRLVSLHHDAQLDALVKKHWGSIQGGTPEERLAEMRRINNDLRAGHGNQASGQALFGKHCATCHRLFGEGNQVGPELTHANRKNTDELLATIVNPSAVIRREYLSFLVHTTDGRVVTGLLVDQTPGSVTLLSAKNQRTAVPRDEIESIVESPTSLMPDDLLKGLKPQELRDLFSYLQSEPPASAAN